MTTDITVLKSLIALRLDINIWSARKKLTAADFGDANLPPETLASLGFKKICSPDDLKIFATLKARAVNMLDRIGVRFLGGWAIPESRIQDVMDDLDLIAMEFDSAKNNFLNSYHQAVRDWIDQNPGWETMITSSIVDVDTVRKRFGFHWQMYQVAPPKKSSAAHGQGQLDDAVTGLGNTLFAEIAKAADEAWTKSYAGKTEVGQKALSPLRTIRDKLAGLSFIEPRVMPMVSLIDEGLKLAPGRGVIRNSELLTLQGLVCLLRDPAAMSEHAQAIIDGQSSVDILGALLSRPQSPEPSAPQPTTETPPPSLNSLGLW